MGFQPLPIEELLLPLLTGAGQEPLQDNHVRRCPPTGEMSSAGNVFGQPAANAFAGRRFSLTTSGPSTTNRVPFRQPSLIHDVLSFYGSASFIPPTLF